MRSAAPRVAGSLRAPRARTFPPAPGGRQPLNFGDFGGGGGGAVSPALARLQVPPGLERAGSGVGWAAGEAGPPVALAGCRARAPAPAARLLSRAPGVGSGREAGPRVLAPRAPRRAERERGVCSQSQRRPRAGSAPPLGRVGPQRGLRLCHPQAPRPSPRTRGGAAQPGREPPSLSGSRAPEPARGGPQVAPHPDLRSWFRGWGERGAWRALCTGCLLGFPPGFGGGGQERGPQRVPSGATGVLRGGAEGGDAKAPRGRPSVPRESSSPFLTRRRQPEAPGPILEARGQERRLKRPSGWSAKIRALAFKKNKQTKIQSPADSCGD